MLRDTSRGDEKCHHRPCNTQTLHAPARSRESCVAHGRNQRAGLVRYLVRPGLPPFVLRFDDAPPGEGQATVRPTPHNGQRTTRRSRARTRARGRRKVEANAEPEGPATRIHREHPSIYARGSPLSRAASVRPGALNLSSVKKNAGARSRAAFPFAGFGADCGARCSGLSSPARLAARPDTRAAPAPRARRRGEASRNTLEKRNHLRTE